MLPGRWQTLVSPGRDAPAEAGCLLLLHPYLAHQEQQTLRHTGRSAAGCHLSYEMNMVCANTAALCCSVAFHWFSHPQVKLPAHGYSLISVPKSGCWRSLPFSKFPAHDFLPEGSALALTQQHQGRDNFAVSCREDGSTTRIRMGGLIKLSGCTLTSATFPAFCELLLGYAQFPNWLGVTICIFSTVRLKLLSYSLLARHLLPVQKSFF